MLALRQASNIRHLKLRQTPFRVAQPGIRESWRELRCFDYVTSALARRNKDGNLIKLSGGKAEIILALNKRGVNICFGQEETVQIRTFNDFGGQKHYFRYTCHCQIPAYEIIYDPEALSN